MENINLTGVVIDIIESSVISILGYKALIKDKDKSYVTYLSDKDMFTEPVKSLMAKSLPCKIVTKNNVRILSDAGIKTINRNYYALNKQSVVLLDEASFSNIARQNPTGSILIQSTDRSKISSEVADRLRNDNTSFYGIVNAEQLEININPNLKTDSTEKSQEPRVEVSNIVESSTIDVKPQEPIKASAPPVQTAPKAPTVLDGSKKSPKSNKKESKRRPSSINPEVILPEPDKNGLYYGKTEEEYVYNSLLVKFLNSAILDYDYGVSYENSDSDDITINLTAVTEIADMQARFTNVITEVDIAKKTTSCKEIYLYLIDCYDNMKPIAINGRTIDPVTGKYIKNGTTLDYSAPVSQRVDIPNTTPANNTQAKASGNIMQGNAMTESKLLKFIKINNRVIGYLIHIKGTLISNNKKLSLDDTVAFTQSNLFKTLKSMPMFTTFINASVEFDNVNSNAILQVSENQATTLSNNPMHRIITPLDLFDVVSNIEGTTLKFKYKELSKVDTDKFRQIAQIELNTQKSSASQVNSTTPNQQSQVAADIPKVPSTINTTTPVDSSLVTDSAIETASDSTQNVEGVDISVKNTDDINMTTKYIGVYTLDNQLYVVYTNNYMEFKSISYDKLTDYRSSDVVITPSKTFIIFANGTTTAFPVKK